MRTAILFGLIIVAMSINPDIKIPQELLRLMGTVLTVSMVMDIMEFIKKMYSNKG